MGFDKYFRGKRVIVTGASRGIGKALVTQLYAYDAIIYALARSPERLAALKEEFPKVETRAVDLENWEATRSVIKSIGPIDFLVNNAAAIEVDDFLKIRPESFDKIFNTGLKSVINVSQVVASGMIEVGKGGSIVNVSSLGAKKAFPKIALYCSSKAGLDMLTRCMALELGPHNIRVNSVNPAAIDTDMWKYLAEQWNTSGAEVVPEADMKSKAPLGKHVFEMDDMVSLTLFVLSNMVPSIHGESILMDGGLSIA